MTKIMNNVLFGVTLLMLLILVPMVTADIQVNTYTPSKDFTLTSAYNQVSICSCSTKYDSITITNTGTWPAIFTISTNEITSKLTLSQNNFELQPGQSQEVFLYITADCSKGSEDLKITVTSNLGTVKTLEKQIIRDRCQNIEMWISNYTKNINPCDSKTFQINVHNIGPFADSYTLSSNYDDFITYNAKAFNLGANQFVEISATAKFGCDVYGQKDIIFTTHSTKNKLTASLDAPLNIARTYDYDLKINQESNNAVSSQVCNRVYSTQIPVSITNKGSVANEYTVQIDNLPKFVKVQDLDFKTFNLNPGETKIFYIDVDSSSYRSETNTKEISIKVSSKYGDVNKESKLLLNFEPCYEHQVIIYNSDNSKNSAMKTCAGYDYSYDVDVINKGIFTEIYTLSLEVVPSTVKLSTNKVILKAGEKTTVQLLVKGPEYNTYYDMKVRATISNGLSEVDDTWIHSYDTQSCHAIAIGKSNFRINYQTKEITIPITNKGITANSYKIYWDGSDIVDSSEITLNENISDTKKAVLSIDSSNKTEDIYDGKIIVKTNGATYSQDVAITLKDKSIVRKAFEYMTIGSICRQVSLFQFVAILLIIILIIVFLIRGPHYPYKFWNRVKAKTSVIVFLIVLFLIGLILVITVAGFPKTHAQVYNLTASDSELTYEWLQDEKYVLDVSKFFYSPENSTLKYEVVGLKHIQTSSSGQKITFYPDQGWSGFETAKITAYDNRGGSVISPEFTLIVRSVPKKTFTELFNIYCWYINLVIFAIVLLFVFIAVFVKQKRRGRKITGHTKIR